MTCERQSKEPAEADAGEGSQVDPTPPAAPPRHPLPHSTISATHGAALPENGPGSHAVAAGRLERLLIRPMCPVGGVRTRYVQRWGLAPGPLGNLEAVRRLAGGSHPEYGRHEDGLRGDRACCAPGTCLAGLPGPNRRRGDAECPRGALPGAERLPVSRGAPRYGMQKNGRRRVAGCASAATIGLGARRFEHYLGGNTWRWHENDGR